MEASVFRLGREVLSARFELAAMVEGGMQYGRRVTVNSISDRLLLNTSLLG